MLLQQCRFSTMSYFLKPRLRILTIFLFLGQDGDLLSFGQVQQKQHCLLTNDVGKVHIVYLGEKFKSSQFKQKPRRQFSEWETFFLNATRQACETFPNVRHIMNTLSTCGWASGRWQTLFWIKNGKKQKGKKKATFGSEKMEATSPGIPFWERASIFTHAEV